MDFGVYYYRPKNMIDKQLHGKSDRVALLRDTILMTSLSRNSLVSIDNELCC